jgi:hypothetical protein
MVGLIKEKQSTMYADWMKDTGYNLFQKKLNEMLKPSNYIKIVEHHILIKLMDILDKPITNFDETSSQMVNLNVSIQKLRLIVKKYVVPDNISTVITSITMKIDDYLTKGIDSYSASTVELADSFIDKIGKFFSKVKNLFTNNPFETTQEKLHVKRISLLNNQLALKYDEKIFKELIDRKMLDDVKFKESLINTLKVSSDNKYIFNIIITLIKSVFRCTNKIDYITMILERYQALPLSFMFINDVFNHISDVGTYKEVNDKPEYHQSFCEMLILLSSYLNISDNINSDSIHSIINVISKYLKPFSVDSGGATENMHGDYNKQLQLINCWINSNISLINSNTDVIKYIYYHLKAHLSTFDISDTYNTTMTIDSFEGYKNMNRRMIGLFDTLCYIFEKKAINTQVHTKDITNISNIEQNETESFIDAEDHSDNNLEDYRDSDDSSTVYKKATYNARKRMNNTLKKATE